MLFSAEKIHTTHQQAFFHISSINKLYLAFFFLYYFLQRKNIASKNSIKGPVSHRGKDTGPMMPLTIGRCLKLKSKH